MSASDSSSYEEYIPKFIRDVKAKNKKLGPSPKIVRDAEWYKDRYGITDAEMKKLLKEAKEKRKTPPSLPVILKEGNFYVEEIRPTSVEKHAYDRKAIARRRQKSVWEKRYDLSLLPNGPVVAAFSDKLENQDEAPGHNLDPLTFQQAYLAALNTIAYTNIIDGSNQLYFCTGADYSPLPSVTINEEAWNTHDVILMEATIIIGLAKPSRYFDINPKARLPNGTLDPAYLNDGHSVLFVFDKRTNAENPKKRVILYDPANWVETPEWVDEDSMAYNEGDVNIMNITMLFEQQKWETERNPPRGMNSQTVGKNFPDFYKIGKYPGSFYQKPEEWTFVNGNKFVFYQSAYEIEFIGNDCTIFVAWFMFWYLLHPYVSLVEAPPTIINYHPALFLKFAQYLAMTYTSAKNNKMNMYTYADTIIKMLQTSGWETFIGGRTLAKCKNKKHKF